jgi:hypothetical protein
MKHKMTLRLFHLNQNGYNQENNKCFKDVGGKETLYTTGESVIQYSQYGNSMVFPQKHPCNTAISLLVISPKIKIRLL